MTSREAPALLVVGAAPEVGEHTVDVRVVRVGALSPEAEGPFVAAVFDLRSALVAELTEVRARPEIAGVPLLLVSAGEIPESVFSLLGADDGVVLSGPSRGELRRRVSVLLALGRARSSAGERRPSEPEPSTPKATSNGAVARRIEEGGAGDPREELAWLRSEYDARRLLGRRILDRVDVGIVTSDRDGIVTFANRAALGLLRLQRDPTGVAAVDLLGLPQAPSELVRDAARCELAYPYPLSDGGQLDLEVSVFGAGEEALSLGNFVIFRDVREEKVREAERRRFERLAAMGTMVAGFAHEVRNPVAAMRSIAEELDEELRDSGVSMPHVGLLLQMVSRVERLVRTSLQFGRPAAPRRAHHHPSAIVASAMAELRPRLRAPSVQIAVDVEADLPDVHVDERHIAQVLVILLQNALDAAGSAARVRMRLRFGGPPYPDPRGGQDAREAREPREAREAREGTAVTFEVINDGAGIAPEVLGRIFDPFFTTKTTGTGLGLSIAQQLAHENCGRLGVDSPPGGPTSFWLVVPT